MSSFRPVSIVTHAAVMHPNNCEQRRAAGAAYQAEAEAGAAGYPGDQPGADQCMACRCPGVCSVAVLLRALPE